MHVLKPSKEELVAARGKTVPDLITANLHVLFCGINPGLYSGLSAITLRGRATGSGRYCTLRDSPTDSFRPSKNGSFLSAVTA